MLTALALSRYACAKESNIFRAVARRSSLPPAMSLLASWSKRLVAKTESHMLRALCEKMSMLLVVASSNSQVRMISATASFKDESTTKMWSWRARSEVGRSKFKQVSCVGINAKVNILAFMFSSAVACCFSETFSLEIALKYGWALGLPRRGWGVAVTNPLGERFVRSVGQPRLE